jgi:hypothetical protein
LHPSCVGAPSGDPLAAAADGDSTDPIRASSSANKDKNLTNDFAARSETVAAGAGVACKRYSKLAITCLTTV